MNGSRRLQINLHVLHDQSIGYEKLRIKFNPFTQWLVFLPVFRPISTDKDMFMPMMWLDEVNTTTLSTKSLLSFL